MTRFNGCLARSNGKSEDIQVQDLVVEAQGERKESKSIIFAQLEVELICKHFIT